MSYVLEKTRMPNGTDIQLEDWRDEYPSIHQTLSIGTYPIAKQTGRYGFVRKGETFRLDLKRAFSSDAEVMLIYNALEQGKITLEELHEHYYNGDKDRFYMGLREEEPIG